MVPEPVTRLVPVVLLPFGLFVVGFFLVPSQYRRLRSTVFTSCRKDLILEQIQYKMKHDFTAK